MLRSYIISINYLDIFLLYIMEDIVLVMDLIRVAKNIADRVQERLSNLIVDKPLNVLIDEEIKRECIGTDQSNQCTQEILKSRKV